jgi:hypothetical protein
MIDCYRSIQSQRGLHVVYREGEVNVCPACTSRNWWVGKKSAECGRCGCVLPLEKGLSS